MRSTPPDWRVRPMVANQRWFNSVSLTDMRKDLGSTNHRDPRLSNTRFPRDLTWLRFKPDQDLQCETFLVRRSHFQKYSDCECGTYVVVGMEFVRASNARARQKAGFRSSEMAAPKIVGTTAAPTCVGKPMVEGLQKNCIPQGAQRMCPRPDLHTGQPLRLLEISSAQRSQIGSHPHPPLADWIGQRFTTPRQ